MGVELETAQTDGDYYMITLTKGTEMFPTNR